MIRTATASRVNLSFDSLAEFVDYAETGKSEMNDDRRYSRNKGDASWSGTDTFAEALPLAFGWAEGAERIQRLVARVAPRDQKNRQETVASVVGPGVISMGNYLSGHPKAFLIRQDTAEARSGKGKIVRIVVNIAASAGIDGHVIERRGAAVLALVAAIEKSGKRCEVEIVEGTSRGQNRLAFRIMAKRADAKLNLYTLAFAMAHPAMLRRVVFSAMECEPSNIRSKIGIPGGYGTPCDIDYPAGAIYLGKMLYGAGPWGNDAAAEAWVRETAEAQGVRF